jgi:replication factor A1
MLGFFREGKDCAAAVFLSLSRRTVLANHCGGINTLRHRNVAEGEYLALLSVKHSVDPDRLFQALTATKERQRIMCGGLSIECRGRSGTGRIFLMMDGSKVVAQVRIRDGFLSEKINPISKFKDCERVRNYLAKKAACTFKLSTVSDLIVGMNSINLTGKILELDEPKLLHTRWGVNCVVGNALIGDDTGTVKLVLWGDQMDSVSVGDKVQIVNARMRAFKGEKQLQVGRNGAVKVEREQPITKVGLQERY